MPQRKKMSRRKLKGIDIALLIVAVFDVFFTLVMCQLFYLFQTVPDSLIVAVFGVTFGECGFCTLVYKIKKGIVTKENNENAVGEVLQGSDM